MTLGSIAPFESRLDTPPPKGFLRFDSSNGGIPKVWPDQTQQLQVIKYFKHKPHDAKLLPLRQVHGALFFSVVVCLIKLIFNFSCNFISIKLRKLFMTTTGRSFLRVFFSFLLLMVPSGCAAGERARSRPRGQVLFGFGPMPHVCRWPVVGRGPE